MSDTVPLPVLLALLEPIEATGGVKLNDQGLHVPVGDETWVDLGEAYFEVCHKIGRTPVVFEGPDMECEDCGWTGSRRECGEDIAQYDGLGLRCPACGSADIG